MDCTIQFASQDTAEKQQVCAAVEQVFELSCAELSLVGGGQAVMVFL